MTVGVPVFDPWISPHHGVVSLGGMAETCRVTWRDHRHLMHCNTGPAELVWSQCRRVLLRHPAGE